MDKTDQILIDKIACYQSAIKQIDDKLNLISFIGSVNKSFIPQDLLNFNELKIEKRALQKELRLLKFNKGLI